MENELLENINRNLEIIIGLLLRNLPGSDATSLRDRILTLTAMGMRPKEIARALGKSANHINKELSLGRSTKQSKGKSKQ
jgi:hypothetical protein